MTGSTYEIHTARAVRYKPEILPRAGGVYWFLLNDPASLRAHLSALGAGLSRLEHGGQPVLYIGSGGNLRRRVMNHLRDQSIGSTFRGSLGCLLAEDLGLRLHGRSSGAAFEFGPGERKLTRWILDHCDIAVRTCANPLQVERVLIEHGAPIMNIAFQGGGRLARELFYRRRSARRALAKSGYTGPLST